MEEFINEFLSVMTGGTIYNIIILVFAIVGIGASFYFYKRSKKMTSVAYAVRTIRLISKGKQKLSDINMVHRDNSPVTDLSISKIALWNDGIETINADSIARINTLRIEVDSRFEILGANIQFEKNPSNDFHLSISENRKVVNIKFDYFDPDEGVVIQLYHTGEGSNDVHIVGQIKACRQIRRIKPYSTSPMPMPDFKIVNLIRINNREYRLSNYKLMMFYGWFIMAIAATMVFFGLRDIWSTPGAQEVARDPFMDSVGVMLLGVIYGFVGYRVVKRRIPKGFDIFNEEF